MQLFIKSNTDPCDVIRLFPDLLPNDSDNPAMQYASNFDKLVDKDLENGLLALIEYLREVRLKVQLEIKTCEKQNQSSSTTETTKKNPLLPIIDTTLLKCYLQVHFTNFNNNSLTYLKFQTNDSFVAPLLRLNHCHLEESEKTLIKYGKLGELIILYQTKGQHKLALELLRTQADVRKI